MSGFDTNARRIVALLLFMGFPLVLLGLGVTIALRVADDRTRLAEMEYQLARLRDRLQEPAADGSPVDISGIYLTGDSLSLASANLQQQLVFAISATQGRLIETAAVERNSATDAAEPVNGVALKSTLDITNNGLLQLLYLLESGLPLVDVETLSVRRLPTAGDEDLADPVLRVDLVVRGYRPPEADDGQG